MDQSRNFKSEFLRTFTILSYSHNKYNVWQDFIFASACSFSNAVDKFHFAEREKEYLQRIHKYDKKEQQLFPKLLSQVVMEFDKNTDQDLLGDLFMDLNFGDACKGQFFTPYHVCKLMSEITLGDVVSEVKDKGYISIHDCACGAGATFIAAVNDAKEKLAKAGINYQNHIFVTAQDIDQTVALMCYIQLSLLGVAGFVKIGDSLANPMSTDDGGKNYWYIPMYFSRPWQMRKLIKQLKGEK